MSMVLQAAVEGKRHELQSQMEELQGFIRTAAATGLAVHEVEQGLFKRLLELGYQLQRWFFALLGDGDQGETVTTGEGRVLRRLPSPHRRAYQSIFGHFELERVVYGTREGQQVEYVPLDTRVRLPAGKFSYLLQDWDQALAVETPYQQVNGVLQRMLGLKQSVASLEQMTRTLAEAVEGYWAEQAPAPAARAGQIVVLSADSKGVPMRKPAAAPPIAAHQHQKGPKPGRKKRAVVGTVYQIDRHRRTPEEVVQALFREPGAAAPRDDTAPSRPVPEHQRVRVNLPGPEAAPPVGASEAMFDWLVEQARSRDPVQQRPWVVIMDGQPSLWEEAEQALGEAPRVEILDLLHATSHLWEAVHLFHAPGSAEALKLMELLVLALLLGMSEGVVNLLEAAAVEVGLSRSRRRQLTKICNYLRRHQVRMRYHEYLAAGYPIASGVIEGACRHGVKDRMERAGMHWTLPGAQALLRLRCVALHGEWEAFLQYRIQQETARLYPYANLVDQAEWPLPLAA
jgi:DNA-binding transcriptional ArsR family regulator